jgi:HAD superfamily hydrolase (TIGR01490 family)
VEESIVDAGEYQRANDRFYEEYLNGELDIMRYLSFALQPLALHDMNELLLWREQFIEQKVRPMLQRKAADLLEYHREQQHTLMIITATNRFVTEPVAELLGVEHLIATEPELVNGRYTGGVAGTPSFQQGKVERLHDWLQSTGETLDGAWFYSDSHNDLPLLRLVDNPVAVDPDPNLEAIARENGWPVMSLRG